MISVKTGLGLLGMKVSDKVTGFSGVVTSVSFDLYGCVQALVHPGVDENGKLRDQAWFDIIRLVQTQPVPVMESPKFVDASGPAEKPRFTKS